MKIENMKYPLHVSVYQAGFVQVMGKLKVMELMISISRPGKSWISSEGHGKLWKSTMLSKKAMQNDKKFEK